MSIVLRKAASVFAVFSMLIVAGCSGQDGGPSGTGPDDGKFGGNDDGKGSSGVASSSSSSGGASSSSSSSSSGSTPAAACGLPEITGVADVKPTFIQYDQAKGTVPPAMKGGKADGKYKVDKATVYLPASVKGLAKPESSKGTINSWAIFDGKSYRLSLEADLSIDSIIGPQPTKEDVVAQGAFTATGEKIKLESSCDSSKPVPDAELSFTENGARATLLVKTKVTQGDVYILLEGTKQ